jgi:penicillin-binding protein 1A
VNRLAWPLRLVAVLVAGALLLTGVALGVAPRLWLIANAHEELPVELPEFQPLSQRTTVYDRYGGVIAVFQRENTQPVVIDDVPRPVIDALLAVEDTEYFLHKGVNIRGLVRALLSNFSSDAPRQGASTITQQVVKNEFLAGVPRDGRYKLLQAHYALMLERDISKDEILERYLNTVFFGNNAYGLAAGAEVYFGKKVSQLTMVEGAFLAGLVRSPSGYDPINNPEPSRRRFVQVTARLADVGLVSPLGAEALAETWEIPFKVRTLPKVETKPTYFTNTLRDYLLTKSNILGATEQERANLLYRGGLHIHTTLDPMMQNAAETARDILPDSSIGFDAAVVSVDNANGAVRAMVGGRGLRPDVPGGEVNMALVPRQTGSSVKAFILAAAYQAGVQTNDVINGIKPCTVPDYKNNQWTTKTVDSGYGDVGPFDGPNTWSSTDCGFIRLSYAVGLHRIVDTTYRLAKSTYFYQGQPTTDREPFLPLPLTATGNNAMSAFDMATGFQTIANQGLHHEPYFVEYVDSSDGARFYSHSVTGTQVLDPGVANATIASLKGVLRAGTGARNLRNFSRTASGKTGTQYENTNAWFVGATPQLSTAVWVGDPNGYTEMNGIPEFAAEMGRNGKVQGADYPSRIWGAFMEAALADQPNVDWPRPPGLPREPARIYVPGEECVAEVVSGSIPLQPGQTIPVTLPTTPTTTMPPATSTTLVVDPSTPPITDAPPPTAATTTTSPRPVLATVEAETTVPLDVFDPRAPVPSIETDRLVYLCETPPDWVDFINLTATSSP